MAPTAYGGMTGSALWVSAAAVIRDVSDMEDTLPSAFRAQRTCPSPVTTYLVEVISGSPIGPRACSF